MRARLIILLSLTLTALLPQYAAARVYMCVDEATGQTSFTDHACEKSGSREEIRVERANLDSGKTYGRAPKDKTWNSERDERRTGLDLNAQRRGLYEDSATAQRD